MQMTAALAQLQPVEQDGSILAWAHVNPLHWAGNAITAWDEDKFHSVTPFIISHYWSDRHSINVFSVVGTAHPDYISLSWLEFLGQGKRMPVNQHLLQTNPCYYHDTAVKHPSMLYVSLDGKHWYVNGDGNHRTCLARFHFERLNSHGRPSQTMIHGVTVDDYRVDWAFHDVFQRLQNVLVQRKAGRVEVVRKRVSRLDGPAWKHDVFSVNLKYTTSKREETLLDRDAATKLLHDLEHGAGVRAIKRWLGL